MSAYVIADWSNFFVAEAGATAALTGLVIVAISINIPTILKHAQLPSRALESIVPLAGILILSTIGIVPANPKRLRAWRLPPSARRCGPSSQNSN